MSGDLETPTPDVWSGPVQLVSGFNLVHYGPIAEGPALPLALAYGAPRERIIPDPLGPLTEPIFALADAVYHNTGRHGITRISLTPDVGLAFGIAPGTSIDVHTPTGRVEVYAERTPRIEGTFTLGTEQWRLPVHADPSMPPGTFEMRNGEQRIRATVTESEDQCGQCGAVVVGHHACPGVPGDEDRSER